MVSFQWADKADPSIGWNGITKATPLKEFPPEEPNRTNPDEVIEALQKNDEVRKITLGIVCSEFLILKKFSTR